MFIRKNANGENEPSFWHRAPGTRAGVVFLAIGILLAVADLIFTWDAPSVGFVFIGLGLATLLRTLVLSRRR